MVRGPDMKGTVPEILTEALASDANPMYSVGRRDRRDKTFDYIQKITIVLRLFVLAQQALVPFFWLLTCNKPRRVTETQKWLAINSVQFLCF